MVNFPYLKLTVANKHPPSYFLALRRLFWGVHMSAPHAFSFSPTETALYTYEMLESLRKIAVRQDQSLLAHLLHLAAVEAKVQGTYTDQAGQETALPA